MSTNKTQNYQLHSWTPEDEFHLTEINENFTGVDTELAVLDTLLKAETAARTQQLAGKADKTQVAALGRWVTGTYAGGVASVDLGAPILCLHLEDDLAQRPGQYATLAFGGLILPGYPLAYGCASVSGSQLTLSGSHNGYTSMVSVPGRTYHYAALLAQ